jgi:Arc/MetJ-type ribon-helix-helix transcriptional regulator
MNVPLKPALEQFVEDQVKAGRFASKVEVLEAGLARLMLDPPPGDEEIDPQELADIAQSEREIAAGHVVDWKELSARLRRKYLGQ